MPQEDIGERNVKFVLDGYARFNAGEKEAGLWFYSPDAEYQAAREDPDSAIHRGIDAITRQFQGWLDAYPDLTVEPLEAKASGDQVFLWCASAVMERKAGYRWRWSWRTSSRFARAGPLAPSSTWTVPRPSKPPGCGSSAASALREKQK